MDHELHVSIFACATCIQLYTVQVPKTELPRRICQVGPKYPGDRTFALLINPVGTRELEACAWHPQSEEFPTLNS